jgi:hypothetical protein
MRRHHQFAFAADLHPHQALITSFSFVTPPLAHRK